MQTERLAFVLPPGTLRDGLTPFLNEVVVITGAQTCLFFSYLVPETVQLVNKALHLLIKILHLVRPLLP